MNSAFRNLPFVYLTSSPFSGSTLFSFLANTHPQIATVGEMTGLIASQDPESYRCSCGNKIRECPFWKRIVDRMKERGFEFDLGNFDTRLRLGVGRHSRRLLSGSLRSKTLEMLRDGLIRLWPKQRHRLQYLMDRNKALAESVLQVTCASVFFDASKNPMAIRHFHRQPDVDFRVVHLVRDVRGAGLSKRKNRGQSDWRRTVNDWVRMNRDIDSQLRQLPGDRWIRIRYEEMCQSPAETMNRFFRFCKLVPHELPSNFSAVEHHVVGNRMRLTNAGEIRLDEAWREKLNRGERALAVDIAGPMLLAYGYSPHE